jgi:hypothetical protein
MAAYHDSIFGMLNSLNSPVRHAIEIAISFTPWVMSAFLLYWLEYGEVWTTDTAHRGKISVTILIVGMGLSFLVRSHFAKREKR